MPEDWYPWAEQLAGPIEKAGYASGFYRTGKGAIVHSAEGSLDAALAVLRSGRQVSWHFTLAKDGRTFQHYPANFRLWHARTPAGYLYVGIECEGVAGEELTEAQLNALVGVLKWLALVEDWEGFVRHLTLFEHNEFVATACPSGRIPWDLLIQRLNSAAAPGKEVLLKGLIAAAFVVSIGNPLTDLSQEDRDAIRHVADQF